MAAVIGSALGGASGALARYGLDTLIERRSESEFPWATFAINVSGCFVVRFVIAALVDRHQAPHWLRAALVIGFCGGYTTFSTFAQETLDLFEARVKRIPFPPRALGVRATDTSAIAPGYRTLFSISGTSSPSLRV